jgi:hypothetical protein
MKILATHLILKGFKVVKVYAVLVTKIIETTDRTSCKVEPAYFEVHQDSIERISKDEFQKGEELFLSTFTDIKLIE